MSEPKTPVDPAVPDALGTKAEIIDRLYDVALDPIRLGDLLEVWEGRMRLLRRGGLDDVAELNDPEFDVHVSRATIFLDRLELARPDGGYRAVLDDIPKSAAFLSDGGPIILAFNRAAAIAFGLTGNHALTALPFEPDDIETLRGVLRQVANGRGERVVTLRIHSVLTGSPVIVRVSEIEMPDRSPLALVRSTELVWPLGFADIVQEAFGLTDAEVEIVQSITLGLPIRDIAAARRRSQETVRTQMRSILSKTETHSQSELVRVVLGLMDLATSPIGQQPLVPAAPGGAAAVEFHTLRLADGRRLDFIEFGAPGGAPLLYMHLDFGLIRWPRSAEKAAKAAGIRVIVPVRAGYGRSDPVPKGAERTLCCTLDYAAVLDHLGQVSAAVLALGADLRFAMQLANLRPDLVTGIVGCAAQLPLNTAAQYERMDKWQRFILANARYAPKVLPFLVKAGFSLARKLGKERFFTQVNGGSPADIATFGQPEVREAMLLGSEITIHAKGSAHEAFTQECISSERDWSAIVQACKVPVVLLQGDQDPQTPALTIRERMLDFPHLQVTFLPGNGQLLFFNEWPRALAELQRFLRAPH